MQLPSGEASPAVDRDAFLGEIEKYYDETWGIDYNIVWHGRSAGALHYGWWDKTTHNLKGALTHENEVLADIAGIGESDYVLDAGCGVGGSSVYMAANRGATVHGITASQNQVALATERARHAGVGEKASFSRQDYIDTNFEPETFDVVWALESVGHTSDKDEFIHEASRILKPSGRLIVADGWATHPAANEEECMRKLMKGWAGTTLDTMGRFAASLEDNGFVNVQATDETAHVEPTIRHLRRLYYGGYLPNFILSTLGLRSEAERLNHGTARWQYEAFKQGLLHYGVVYAEKAPALLTAEE